MRKFLGKLLDKPSSLAPLRKTPSKPASPLQAPPSSKSGNPKRKEPRKIVLGIMSLISEPRRKAWHGHRIVALPVARVWNGTVYDRGGAIVADDIRGESAGHVIAEGRKFIAERMNRLREQ